MSIKEVNLQAAAKINLYLEVLGGRDDGYHEIESVMQSISLYDKITLRTCKEGINILSDHYKVPEGRNNLCYRAAEIFLGEMNISQGVEIEIHKVIPVEAGLGGGSTDAAATLIGMGKLFGIEVPLSELLKWGMRLGSDVPFCLIGGTALVRGGGEKVISLPRARWGWLVLVDPGIPLSTRWVYRELKEGLTGRRLDVKLLARTLRQEGLCGISPFLYNRLEEVVFKRFPLIFKIKEEMIRSGAIGSLMTGSGSTVFAIVKDKGEGRDILGKLRKRGRAYLVQPVDKSLKEG